MKGRKAVMATLNQTLWVESNDSDALAGYLVSDLMILKDIKQAVWGIISEWRDWGKDQITSVRIGSIRYNIQTRHLQQVLTYTPNSVHNS
jgi:hypothetical protein